MANTWWQINANGLFTQPLMSWAPRPTMESLTRSSDTRPPTRSRLSSTVTCTKVQQGTQAAGKVYHTLLPHARLCNTARSALAERSEKNLLTLSSTWQNLARPSQHSFVITAVLREFLGAHHGTWCTVWQPCMLNWARLALCSFWASFIASQYEFNKLFIDSTQKCCYYEVQRCA